MHPPTKNQADIGVDNPTIDTSDGVDLQYFGTNKDTARQEFKDEADINYMLSKFGITQPRGTPIYGEWDDSIDLQVALQSVHDAKEAYKQLDPALQAKFGSIEELLTALENGSLVIKNENAPDDTTTTTTKPVDATTNNATN